MPQLTLSNIIQSVKTDTFTSSANTFTAIPGLSVTITPSALTSEIWVTAVVAAGADGSGNPVYFQVQRNGTPICIGDAAGSRLQASGAVGHHFAGNPTNWAFSFLDSPNSMAPVTYQVLAVDPNPGGSFYINQTSADTNSGLFGRSSSTITVIDVPA
jgi:hypothetical protein